MTENFYTCDGCGTIIKSENGVLSNKCPACNKLRLENANIQRKQVIIMSGFSPVPFAEEIQKDNKFIEDKYKRFWKYDKDNGIWEENADSFIKKTLRNNLFGDEQQKKKYVDEVVSYIKESNHNDNFKPNADPYLIAFKNKVFNLNSNQWEDFKPEYYLTNKIDIEIDENIKECPIIDKFFCESVGEEYKQILYDLASYNLFRALPYQKVFFIYGSASTGKSQYMNLLEKFLGEDNCCSFEPRDIEKDQYAGGQMLYKLSNIASDINYDALDSVNQIKKLTGTDTIKVRLMYKEPFNEKIYCKQIFSTNKLPEVKEKTNAWYRRIYPIEFNNTVSKEKRNPFLLKEMTTKEELQGFAYKCIESLKELKENNFIFTWDIDEDEMRIVYEELSNPILKFIKENTDECRGDSNYWIYQFEFKERLNNWMTNNHYPVMTSMQINNYMNEFYNQSNRANLKGNGQYRVWVGLKHQESSHNPTNLNHLNHFCPKIKKLYMGRGSLQTPLNRLRWLSEEKQ